MPIEEKDIAKVAQLAHLELDDEELKVFGPQIAGIITYVEQLNQLDTENVPPAPRMKTTRTPSAGTTSPFRSPNGRGTGNCCRATTRER